jgi:hypothetical protein
LDIHKIGAEVFGEPSKCGFGGE